MSTTGGWLFRDKKNVEPMCSEADWEDTLAAMVACSSRGQIEGTAWILAQCTPPYDGDYTLNDAVWMERIFRDPVLIGDHQELWEIMKGLCSMGLPSQFFQDYASWLKRFGWRIDSV